MMKKETIKFNTKTVWSYGRDKIKVFVPSIIAMPFKTFCNREGIKTEQAGIYKFGKKKKSTKKQEIDLIEGHDYITSSDNKDIIVKFLKKSYKEIN